MAKQFYIHEANMDTFYKRMDTLRKKCSKAGAAFSYKIVGSEYGTDVLPSGERVTCKYYIVEAEGCAIIKGWELIGVIEYINGSTIVTEISSISVPRYYYTSGNVCEHCHSDRPRKKTCILYNSSTDEYKQVGTTCLKAFTGADNVNAYLRELDVIKEFESWDHAIPDNLPKGDRRYSLTDILAYDVAIVQNFGYVSTKDYMSTADRVKLYYFFDTFGDMSILSYGDLVDDMDCCKSANESEEYLKVADDIINYVRNTLQDDSNYAHNLKTIFADDYIRRKDIGMAVSAIVSYNKYIKSYKQTFQAGRNKSDINNSSFVGEVGDKVTVDIADFACVYSYENVYGTSRIYKFKDTSGNVFVWKTTCYVANVEGVVSISGQVKAHTEFRGVKETQLTRCKLNRGARVSTDLKSSDEVGEALDMLFASWA